VTLLLCKHRGLTLIAIRKRVLIKLNLKINTMETTIKEALQKRRERFTPTT